MQLARNEVHCSSFGLEITPQTCTALSAILSRDEQVRSARLRSPQLQRRFIAAHGGLRQLLGLYLRADPSEFSFVHNEFGKPALCGAFAGRIQFNLSHAADLALIGVAVGAEIGVDVEQIREEPEFSEIAQSFFTATRVEELNRLPSALRAQKFLSFWTRNEAYAKARGEGIGTTTQIPQSSGWSFYPLQPAPGYVGALAVEGSGWRVTHRSVSLDALLSALL